MFTAERGVHAPLGWEEITLRGAGHEVRILPFAGFNLWYWTFEGNEILMEPVDIRVYGTKYGIPILFPTPNRIPDGRYTWQGETRVLSKRGAPVLIHGLVKDEPFAVTALTAGEEEAACTGEIRIEEGSPLAEGWPFPCALSVTYRLRADGLHMEAEIANEGTREMPFGFALHPYFSKRGDANRVFLTVPLSRLYETDERLIPTGRILPADAAHTLSDGYHSVESLYVDNVYRGMTEDLEAKIRYEDAVVHISGSDCFRNAVVYTPHDRPGFCIELQTCATDFINLHERGLVDESGLMVLPAGRRFSCRADFVVERREA